MSLNLFSSFDPMCTTMGWHSSWLILLYPALMIPSLYWAFLSSFQGVVIKMAKSMALEFKSSSKRSKRSNILMLLAIFMMILTYNMTGLAPYVFTATAHINLTLILALSLWLSIMIYSLANKMISTLAHMVPLGAPSSLMFFMVLVETVSILIRPITLSVRLAANMTAGHILLILLGSAMSSSALSGMLCVSIAHFLMYLLELGVALIQAYVFTVLVSLYIYESS